MSRVGLSNDRPQVSRKAQTIAASGDVIRPTIGMSEPSRRRAQRFGLDVGEHDGEPSLEELLSQSKTDATGSPSDDGDVGGSKMHEVFFRVR